MSSSNLPLDTDISAGSLAETNIFQRMIDERDGHLFPINPSTRNYESSVHNIGSVSYRWRNLYLSEGINLNNDEFTDENDRAIIKASSDNILFQHFDDSLSTTNNLITANFNGKVGIGVAATSPESILEVKGSVEDSGPTGTPIASFVRSDDYGTNAFRFYANSTGNYLYGEGAAASYIGTKEDYELNFVQNNEVAAYFGLQNGYVVGVPEGGDLGPGSINTEKLYTSKIGIGNIDASFNLEIGDASNGTNAFFGDQELDYEARINSNNESDRVGYSLSIKDGVRNIRSQFFIEDSSSTFGFFSSSSSGNEPSFVISFPDAEALRVTDELDVIYNGTLVQNKARTLVDTIGNENPNYRNYTKITISHSTWGLNNHTGMFYLEFMPRQWAGSEKAYAYGVVTYHLDDDGVTIDQIDSTGLNSLNIDPIVASSPSDRVLEFKIRGNANADNMRVYVRAISEYITNLTAESSS